ncbi:MAG TPA: hypothetical protein V6C81_03715 [Planktothrix sp.]|jgi:hypothetical protein
MSKVLKGKEESNVRLLDEQEAVEFFDEQVRALLGVSAKEFLTRRQNGVYKDACDNPKVLKLLMMIPKP